MRVVRRDDPWVPSAPVLEGGMQFIEDVSCSLALSRYRLNCVAWMKYQHEVDGKYRHSQISAPNQQEEEAALCAGLEIATVATIARPAVGLHG